jgi:hypothetical protein
MTEFIDVASCALLAVVVIGALAIVLGPIAAIVRLWWIRRSIRRMR